MQKTNMKALLMWVIVPACCGVVSWWLASVRSVNSSAAMNEATPEISQSMEGLGDVLASWRRAQSEGDPVKRVAKMWEASLPMTTDAFHAAMEEALIENDRNLILALGEAWAQSDPEALIRWLEEGGVLPEIGKLLLEAAYDCWANSDAAAAFESLMEGEDNCPSRLVEIVCLPYLSEHPEELERVFDAMGSSIRNSLMRGSEWAFLRPYQMASTFSGDGALLAKGFHALPSGPERDVFAGLIGKAILTKAPTKESNARFWDWWQALPPDLQGKALPDVSRDLSESVIPPLATRDQVAQLAQVDKDVVPAYMHFWGAAWAKVSPDEAREWVLEAYDGESLPGMYWAYGYHEPGSRQADDFGHALVPTFRTLAAQDPQQAIAALNEVPHLEVQASMAREVAQTWAKTEPRAALEWAAQQPSPRLRFQAGSSALKGWAEVDLEAATAQAIQTEDFEYGGTPLGTLSGVVEAQGPKASSAWLASLPEEAIDRTLARLISNPPQFDRLRPFQKALESLPDSSGKAYISALIEERVQEMD